MYVCLYVPVYYNIITGNYLTGNFFSSNKPWFCTPPTDSVMCITTQAQNILTKSASTLHLVSNITIRARSSMDFCLSASHCPTCLDGTKVKQERKRQI